MSNFYYFLKHIENCISRKSNGIFCIFFKLKNPVRFKEQNNLYGQAFTSIIILLTNYNAFFSLLFLSFFPIKYEINFFCNLGHEKYSATMYRQNKCVGILMIAQLSFYSPTWPNIIIWFIISCVAPGPIIGPNPIGLAKNPGPAPIIPILLVLAIFAILLSMGGSGGIGNSSLSVK